MFAQCHYDPDSRLTFDLAEIEVLGLFVEASRRSAYLWDGLENEGFRFQARCIECYGGQCGQCREQNRETAAIVNRGCRASMIARGTCTRCFRAPASPGYQNCGACRAKVAAKDARRRAARTANGICNECPAPARSGRRLCGPCQKRATARTQRSMAKAKRAAGALT